MLLRFCNICRGDSLASISGPKLREFTKRILQSHQKDPRHIELSCSSKPNKDIRESIALGLSKEISKFSLCISSAYVVAKSNSSYEHYELLMEEKKCFPALTLPSYSTGSDRLTSAGVGKGIIEAICIKLTKDEVSVWALSLNF